MALRNGALIKNRRRISLEVGDNDIDTGLRTPVLAFKPDPGLDGSQIDQIASRVMVVPLAPIDKWAGVTHEEPFVDPATGTVHVVFNNSGQDTVADLNVYFDAVHTVEAPVSADTYSAAQPEQLVVPELGGGRVQIGIT